MRGFAVVVLSLALAACTTELTLLTTSEDTTGAPGTASSTAGETSLPTTGSPDATTGSATTGGTSGAVAATTGEEGTSTGASLSTSTGEVESTGGSTSGSTSEAGDATTEDFTRPFDCYGCLCDADVHYCQQVFGGVVPLSGCPEVRPDSLESGCVRFPEACGDKPTCDCLPTMKDACYCKEVATGVFEVICPNP